VTYDGAGHGFTRAGEAPDAKEADKKARDEFVGTVEEAAAVTSENSILLLHATKRA
jgi:hypothetical protein